MMNKHTVDYHPSPSELTSSIHFLIIFGLLRGEFFLKPVYPTMLAEKLKIHCVKITGKLNGKVKN